MTDKESLIFCDILLNLEKISSEYIEMNKIFIRKISDYINTDSGKKILQLIEDQKKSTKNEENRKNLFLNVGNFKDGLMIGLQLRHFNSFDMKEIDEFINNDENKALIEESEIYNEKTNVLLNRIDTLVDMFFTNYYKLNNKVKDKFFWTKFKKELQEFGVDIQSIMSYMRSLKDLRKLRNLFEHNNGVVNEQFSKYYDIHTDCDYSIIGVYCYKICEYIIDFFYVFKTLLKRFPDFSVKSLLINCPNLTLIVTAWEKIKENK